MSKSVYIVNVTIPILVVADSEDAAERLAEEHWRWEAGDPDLDVTPIKTAAQLPSGFEGCTPYCDPQIDDVVEDYFER